MKARIAPVRYELFADDGTSLGFFEVVSAWEGMVKLQNADKQVIVIDALERGGLKDLFSAVLGDNYRAKEPEEVRAYRASPELALLVKKGGAQ